MTISLFLSVSFPLIPPAHLSADVMLIENRPTTTVTSVADTITDIRPVDGQGRPTSRRRRVFDKYIQVTGWMAGGAPAEPL